MPTTSKLITAEELLAMGDIGPCELIYGEVVRMSPSSSDHGRISARLTVRLGIWNLQQKEPGVLFVAETGYRLQRNPDLVRVPDLSYVQENRAAGATSLSYFEGPPDLAVEVISPSDSWPDVQAKKDMWLAHGCQSCWIVDPRNQVVHVCRRNGTVQKFSESQNFEDPLLPGFSIAISSIFAV